MSRPRNDRVAFFMHIPKTAGISFYRALSEVFTREEMLPIPVPPPGNTLDETRFPARVTEDLVAAHRAFDPEEAGRHRLVMGHWDHGIVPRAPALAPFTILRDPVTRTVSAYKHAARTDDAWNRYAHERIRDGLRLVDMGNDPHIVEALAAAQARQVAGYTWSRPDEKPADAELLAEAKAHLAQFVCVGPMERLREFGLLVSYAFGWPPLDSIPRLNTASRGHEVAITPEIRDGIRRVCHVDAALYEYAVALYNQRLTAMLDDLLGPEAVPFVGEPRDPTTALSITEDADFEAAAARIRERSQP